MGFREFHRTGTRETHGLRRKRWVHDNTSLSLASTQASIQSKDKSKDPSAVGMILVRVEKGVHTNGTGPLADRARIRVTIAEDSEQAKAYQKRINIHFLINISSCRRIPDPWQDQWVEV